MRETPAAHRTPRDGLHPVSVYCVSRAVGENPCRAGRSPGSRSTTRECPVGCMRLSLVRARRQMHESNSRDYRCHNGPSTSVTALPLLHDVPHCREFARCLGRKPSPWTNQTDSGGRPYRFPEVRDRIEERDLPFQSLLRSRCGRPPIPSAPANTRVSSRPTAHSSQLTAL